MDIQTQISEQCFQRIENEKMIQVLKEETEAVGFSDFFVTFLEKTLSGVYILCVGRKYNFRMKK